MWLRFRLAAAAAAVVATRAERVTPAMAVRDLPTLTAFLDEYEANVVDGTGSTVVHWAASAGAMEAIDYAIAQGADLARMDNEGRTPLHIAALSGHTEAVSRLLAFGASPNAWDATGALPLHRAALAGSAGAVRELTRAAPGAVDARLARTSGTALHAAAYLGHVPVLEALLEAGASPCARDRHGELPIDRYVEEDDDQVSQLLQEPPVVAEAARHRVVAILRGGTLGCGADL